VLSIVPQKVRTQTADNLNIDLAQH